MNKSHDTDGGNGGQSKVGPEDMNPDSTAHFLRTLSDGLDQSVEVIDASTQARLRAARRKALAVGEARSRPAWLMPVGSLAAAAIIAVLTVSLWLVPADNSVDGQLPLLEDIALLSDSEGVEFYADLDFYLWLDDEEKAG